MIICYQKLDLYGDIPTFSEEKHVKEVPYQEIKISEDELAKKYYYQQLGDEEKQIYKEILQGVDENTEEIYVHAADADLVNTIFRM